MVLLLQVLACQIDLERAAVTSVEVDHRILKFVVDVVALPV